MKKNRETIRSAMDRRLSFLDDLPSCRAGVLEQIARVISIKINISLLLKNSRKYHNHITR